ncbi:ATPase SWSAP1 isoform X1 [Peromyscus leucopus]|uniref:ATPase SWSAP1 isoform X1 n=1 Tax=Peromyscus leucopus TaxID=10041 RepID=UPI0010A15420|nr:ATPase SWSAP1 isoform X1 [Peromyscus leucopus]
MAEVLRRVLDAGRAAGPGADGAAGPPLLLLGAPRSAQTSLLFAAALEAAGEGRGPVLFLTRRPLQSLPLNTPAARDHWRLQKIRFQYPSSVPELLQLLASAHEAPGPAPSLLLLDGLEEYLAEDSGAQEAAYVAALLLDTAAYFSGRLGASGSCGLVVALETPKEGDDDAPHLTLLQRYFPARCWLQPDALGLGRQHCLRASLESGQLSPRMEWSVTFLPNGEMTVTPWPPQASKPSPDKTSPSAGSQSLTLVCDSLSGPQFPLDSILTSETGADSKT